MAQTRKPRAPRKSKNIELNMAETVETGTITASDDTAALDALLADLNSDAEVTETPIETEAFEGEEHSDADLEAAVAGAEGIEAAITAATPDHVVEGSPATPTGDASDVTPETAAAAAKKERKPRKHYADKVERLQDRVGADLSSYTVLTAADAGVTDDDVRAAMAATLDIIRKMNKKEQNRAGFLIEFIAGKKANLNEVLHRTLDVLKNQGFISTGKEGNVYQNLLARPYSPAAARAMGGNTVAMFADLKLIVPDGKQRFVANPESLLLAKARALLDAAPVSVETPAAA